MTEERWQHIHEVFQATLDQPASERVAYLGRVCGDDTELRSEVESLLAASEQTGRFDRLAERFEVRDPETESMPDRIGPYRLVREIGRGGMGVVYLAVHEDDQLNQPIALKVFHAGPHRNHLVERFLAERQILAQLEHPNIAHLLSGSVTGDGQPYFAMEYIAGLSITDYCDAHHLGLDDRLRLFLDVCSAVQHAHRHLVVHRDLKPSNIFVTHNGEVKLLDFGIAKLLDETPIQSLTPLTRTGLRLLTPEYASPEQVRSEPITTATDVYQLGVLLYELLTGRRPFRLSSRLMQEVERIICEHPPEKPSTAVTQPSGPAAEESKGMDRLRRRLAGDLDTIVLTAMRKEPERRYPSAAALADDVQRHLDGLPVRARPDTLGYRATKFVRRHRFGVAATALGALLILSFAIAMAVQADRVAQERDRAEEATAFMIRLFEDFDPVQARGGTVTTRTLLDERATRIRTELQTQPLLQAKLLNALGQIYRLRGHYPEAEALLRDALALRLKHLDARHLDVAESRYYLGLVLSEKEAYLEAETLLQEALNTYRRALEPADLRTALVLEELAIVQRTRGDLQGAETLFRELLDMYRAHPGVMDTGLATTLLFLGKVQLEQGLYDEATPLLQEALALRRQHFGEDHPAVANALDGLGELAHAQGDYPSAEQFYRDAYAIRQRLYEEGHSDFASSLTNLGIVLHDQARYDEAEPLLRQALAIARSAFGEQHGMVTDALLYLGSVQTARQNWTVADSFLTASLDTWRSRWLETDHHGLARTLDLLGRVRLEQGNLQSADSLVQQALAMRRRLFSEDHPDVNASRTSLERVQTAQEALR